MKKLLVVILAAIALLAGGCDQLEGAVNLNPGVPTTPTPPVATAGVRTAVSTVPPSPSTTVTPAPAVATATSVALATPQTATAPSVTGTPTGTPTPIPTAGVTPAATGVVWPQSAREAASLFGATEDRWELAEGGWHMKEARWRVVVNPRGFALEGYYDDTDPTKPPSTPKKPPRQFVSAVPIEVQGATIWRDATPVELFCAMIGQKFPGKPYDQMKDLIDAVGFQKPTSCQ